MGKARHTRQGIMIRFDADDAELVDWLGQYAQSQTMTKMVKLACYLMAGLPIPDALQAAAPVVVPAAVEPEPVPAPRPAAYEQTGDTLAGVMQELAALREAVTNQQMDRAPSFDEFPAEDPASSIMGDSRRRRRRTVPARDEAASAWDDSPPGSDDRAVSASGLDFSRPRRARARPMEAEPFNPPGSSPALNGLSPEQNLLQSIRRFGQNGSSRC